MTSKHRVRITHRSTGDPFRYGDIVHITGKDVVFINLRCPRSDKHSSWPMLIEQFEMADKNINSLTFYSLIICLQTLK